MVRIRIALLSALALLAAVPAEAARDVVVRDSPGSAVATCLRPTGTPGLVGMLGPLERRMSPYDLLRVTRGRHGRGDGPPRHPRRVSRRGRRPKRPRDRGGRRDRPCDLRAYVVSGRDRGRGAASGSLDGAGSTRLAIKPPVDAHLAPPSGSSARVVVHGYATDGRAFVTRTVPVELRRKPVRPLPRLLNLRAVRRGRSVVVTWHTDKPARRVRFEAVQQLSGRRDGPVTPKSVLGRGRRSFRVRLAGPADSVGVTVMRNRPPYDDRTVVVPVTG
jgi:hypothetical protein